MAFGQTYVIPPATADVAIRQALTVFVRGSLSPYAETFEAFWRGLPFSRTGARLNFRRSIAEVSWQTLSTADREGPFARHLDLSKPLAGCRGVEFAEQCQDPLIGASVRVVDLAPINGMSAPATCACFSTTRFPLRTSSRSLNGSLATFPCGGARQVLSSTTWQDRPTRHIRPLLRRRSDIGASTFKISCCWNGMLFAACRA